MVDLFVTQEGEVYRRYDNGQIKEVISQLVNGYHKIVVGGEHHYVHRLVAKAYVPNKDGKPYIDHVNGDRTDNSPENLQWVTPAENSQRAHAEWRCLTSPSNVVHWFSSLRKFCRKYDLDHNKVRLVYRGERNHHRGWVYEG